MQISCHTLTVLYLSLRHWDNDCLSGRHPEWPLACKLFNQDGSESLHWSQNSSVNNDWSCKSFLHWVFFPLELFIIVFILSEHLTPQLSLLIFSQRLQWLAWSLRSQLTIFMLVSLELQVKSNRQLEVQLDSSTLVSSLQSIIHLYVNLRSIKCSISCIEFPRLSILVQSLFKSCLSLIPELFVSQLIFRSGWQFEFELKAEGWVNIIQEIQAPHDFLHDLFWHAENVSIILLEPSHSGQPSQSATDFISVQHSEVSISDRQFSVRPDSAVKHQAMAWTIHGLHSESLILDFQDEHVVLVVLVMAWSLPQLEIEDVGRQDLTVSSHSVLSLRNQLVLNNLLSWS